MANHADKITRIANTLFDSVLIYRRECVSAQNCPRCLLLRATFCADHLHVDFHRIYRRTQIIANDAKEYHSNLCVLFFILPLAHRACLSPIICINLNLCIYQFSADFHSFSISFSLSLSLCFLSLIWHSRLL